MRFVKFVKKSKRYLFVNSEGVYFTLSAEELEKLQSIDVWVTLDV